jgi:hypothetical protein
VDNWRNQPYSIELVLPVIVHCSVRGHWIDKVTIVGASEVLVPLMLFPIHASQEVRRACLFHRLVLPNPEETWKSETEASTFGDKSLRGD